MSTVSSTSTSGTQLIQGTSYTSGAGIDVTATVDAIISAKRTPETAWTNDQAALTNQQSALQTLQSEIASLETSFQSLHDPSGVFSGLSVSSSNSSVLNGTADSTAVSGSHTITVSALASASVSYSSTLSSPSSTFAAGDLVLQKSDGSTVTLSLPGDSSTDASGNTTTLSTITLTNAAAYINKQNAGVSASVITDSSGSRLALTSTSTGTAATLAVTSAPGGLSFSNVAGTDASLTVDGVPMTSASNQLTSAINGITVNLTGISSSPVRLTASPDQSGITTAVTNFISAFNTVISDLSSQFQGSTSNSSAKGVLETDSAARLVQQQLLSSAAVLTTGNSAFKTLGSMGITMKDDGTLTLDSKTFSNALNSNASAVQSFFQSTDSGSFAANLGNILSEQTDSVNSPIVLDIGSLKQSYSNDQKNIDDLEAQLTQMQSTLISKYSALDALLKSYPSTMLETNTLLGLNTSSNSQSS